MSILAANWHQQNVKIRSIDIVSWYWLNFVVNLRFWVPAEIRTWWVRWVGHRVLFWSQTPQMGVIKEAHGQPLKTQCLAPHRSITRYMYIDNLILQIFITIYHAVIPFFSYPEWCHSSVIYSLWERPSFWPCHITCTSHEYFYVRSVQGSALGPDLLKLKIWWKKWILCGKKKILPHHYC